MSEWELVIHQHGQKSRKKPSVQYPEWDMDPSENLPVKRLQGSATVSYQDSSGKLSVLKVVRKVPELEEA